MTEERRWQRLHFRSWHRGTREMDLLLGSFADAHLSGFAPNQLDKYEAILACTDPDLYNWITGTEVVPNEHKSEVMNLLLQHRFQNNRVS